MVIDIFTVDSKLVPQAVADARTVVPREDTSAPADLATPLLVGDLQGRSLRLGPPEKITIPHWQVVTALGMPPMHVDFITPPKGSDPEVYNVSVFPDVFNNGYSLTSTTKSSVKSTSTTSYTYSTKESFSEKVSFGLPFIDKVTVALKQSAKQTHKNHVSNKYDTYSGVIYSVNTSTVFDDLIAFSNKRMNIYIYPVLGQTICPADLGKDCAPDQEVPLHVQFSGIDNIQKYPPVGAQTLEWYQPVHEPSNLFSYPGDLAQLMADQPQVQPQGVAPSSPSRLQQLSQDTPWSTTDNITIDLKWDNGTSGTNTIGSTTTHSFDGSASLSGKASVAGVGVSASAKFDYNKSRSFKTLNSSTLKLDESDGVTIDLELAKSTNPNPRQDYVGASYIFGLKTPVGTIQTGLEQPSDVTLPAEGPITVASVANMTSTDPSSSNWLGTGPYTVAPDVALNHPQRWSQLLPAGADTEKVWFNCPVGYNSSSEDPNCRASATTVDLAQDLAGPFYQMKGLFVSLGADSSGPTTQSATAGDILTLRARIYNYSLAEMPEGTTVHVAFYAQPWDPNHGFLTQPGNSDALAPAVFIGQDFLEPIPPFCGTVSGNSSNDTCTDQNGEPVRNWAFATTEWDTSTLEPQPSNLTYWKFWVLTWMEGGSGLLVLEIPGHGLKDTDFRSLIEFNALADVPIETYSNNLGFYNQTFTLLPEGTGVALDAAVEPELGEKKLRINKLRVMNKRRQRGESMTVQAKLESNQPIDDVVVNFYDGHPADDGVLFDVEMISRIAPDQPFVMQVPTGAWTAASGASMSRPSR